MAEVAIGGGYFKVGITGIGPSESQKKLDKFLTFYYGGQHPRVWKYKNYTVAREGRLCFVRKGRIRRNQIYGLTRLVPQNEWKEVM